MSDHSFLSASFEASVERDVEDSHSYRGARQRRHLAGRGAVVVYNRWARYGEGCSEEHATSIFSVRVVDDDTELQSPSRYHTDHKDIHAHRIWCRKQATTPHQRHVIASLIDFFCLAQPRTST